MLVLRTDTDGPRESDQLDWRELRVGRSLTGVTAGTAMYCTYLVSLATLPCQNPGRGQ